MKILCSQRLHDGPLWKVKWRPSARGLSLATCSQDQSVILSDLQIIGDDAAVISPVTQLTGAHEKTVRSIDFGPEGSLLAAASFDGSVSIWRLPHNNNAKTATPTPTAAKCITTLEGHENEVKDAAFAPSGHILATCGRDRTIWLWKVHWDDDADELRDEPEFEVLAILQEHQQDVKALAWDVYNLSELVSVSYDESALVWAQVDLEDDGDWRCVQKLEPPGFGTIWAVAFVRDPAALPEDPPELKLLFLAGEQGRIAVYHKQQQQQEKQQEKRWSPLTLLEDAHQGPIYALDSIRFQNRILLASCGQDRTLKLWHLSHNSLLLLASISLGYELNCVRFKVTDKERLLLAIGDDDGQLHIISI